MGVVIGGGDEEARHYESSLYESFSARRAPYQEKLSELSRVAELSAPINEREREREREREGEGERERSITHTQTNTQTNPRAHTHTW